MLISLTFIIITSFFAINIPNKGTAPYKNELDFKKAWEREITKENNKNFWEYLEKYNTTEKELITPYKKFQTTKTYIDSRGYKRFIDSNKLVHRYQIEKNTGHKLKFNEVVHHIDGNKLNNRLNNLYVCSWEEHDKIHRRNQEKYQEWHVAII